MSARETDSHQRRFRRRDTSEMKEKMSYKEQSSRDALRPFICRATGGTEKPRSPFGAAGEQRRRLNALSAALCHTRASTRHSEHLRMLLAPACLHRRLIVPVHVRARIRRAGIKRRRLPLDVLLKRVATRWPLQKKSEEAKRKTGRMERWRRAALRHAAETSLRFKAHLAVQKPFQAPGQGADASKAAGRQREKTTRA